MFDVRILDAMLHFGMMANGEIVTITFSMSAKSFEDHTATFGPGNPETEPTSYLGDLAKHFAEEIRTELGGQS